MAEPAKIEPTQDTLPPDPYPDYRPVYAWVFQSWLIMFLGVICIALLFYLLPITFNGLVAMSGLTPERSSLRKTPLNRVSAAHRPG